MHLLYNDLSQGSTTSTTGCSWKKWLLFREFELFLSFCLSVCPKTRWAKLGKLYFAFVLFVVVFSVWSSTASGVIILFYVDYIARSTVSIRGPSVGLTAGLLVLLFRALDSHKDAKRKQIKDLVLFSFLVLFYLLLGRALLSCGRICHASVPVLICLRYSSACPLISYPNYVVLCATWRYWFPVPIHGRFVFERKVKLFFETTTTLAHLVRAERYIPARAFQHVSGINSGGRVFTKRRRGWRTAQKGFMQ